jgi:hypothetical protein
MKPAIKRTLVSGAILTVGGTLLGTVGTVLGMTHAFGTLHAQGIVNPVEISSALSWVFLVTLVGTLLGAIGVIVLFIGAILWISSRTPKPALSHSS